MKYVVTPQQMSALDAHMIHRVGIPGIVLMENAASAAAREALRRLPENGCVLVVCGGGNNGGDGLAVLRQLVMRGAKARAALLVDPERLTGDARLNYEIAVSCGLQIEREVRLDACDLIVDAIFGTGLSRDVSGAFYEVIESINASGIPVVAVDIPSGVDGASGRVRGIAVRACATVTFQCVKYGHLLYPGRELTGELCVAPIGIVDEAHTRDMGQWLEDADVATLLPPRKADSHKGANGRALLMAGSEAYTGAALMSAAAALRCGAGLLKAAVPKAVKLAFSALPEAMCIPAGAGGEWDVSAAETAISYLDANDVLALGPGMGSGEGVPMLIGNALKTKKPVVIDADGLNALAREPHLLELLHENAVLTPHPGEMARLMGIDMREVTENPRETAVRAAERWGCTVILKGAVSMIAAPGKLTVNTTGNAGLAKGGSGDVLTGIVLALLAQKLCAYDAARAGSYLLGLCADRALALLEKRWLMPRDVVAAMEGTLKGF